MIYYIYLKIIPIIVHSLGRVGEVLVRVDVGERVPKEIKKEEVIKQTREAKRRYSGRDRGEEPVRV